jgi:SAM-dependent methyltransferase
MGEERVRGRVFGEVADEYDRIRPDYPVALIDTVLAHAADAPGPALEVGAGTGKATVAFAERGLRITAVEPDPAMAEILARRCADLPDITVRVQAFEDYAPEQRFGLLYSAQAWHWIDPARRWQLAADALEIGGSLALFWNFDRMREPEIQREVLAAYRGVVPDLQWDTDDLVEQELLDSWPGPELLSAAGFCDVQARLFGWERTLGRDDYLAFLATHSTIRMLEDSVQRRLFTTVAAALPDDVELAVDTALYLARRG